MTTIEAGSRSRCRRRRRWDCCCCVSKAVFFAAFTGCFLSQVWDQLVKFALDETVMILEKRRDPGLRIPTFAVCPNPGFRPEEMRKLNLSLDQWSLEGSRPIPADFAVASDRDEADEWFSASTLSSADVVEDVKIYSQVEGVFLEVFRNGAVLDEMSSLLEVAEMTSPSYGRCQVVEVKVDVEVESEDVQVTLRYPPGVETVDVYVFESGLEETGVRLNYWLGNFQSFRLPPQIHTTVGLNKKVQNLKPGSRDSGGCAEGLTTRDHKRCLYQKTVDRLKSENLCYWPPFAPFVPADDARVCKSVREVRRSWKDVVQAGLLKVAYGEPSACVPSCQLVDFRFQERSVPEPGMSPWNRTKFWLYYNSVEVQHTRERTLYDLNTIVAAVGGSLGMFLGFSFLGTAVWAVDWVAAGGSGGSGQKGDRGARDSSRAESESSAAGE